MANMKKIEIERLRELVKNGKSVQEILAELDIRDIASLKQALHGEMQREGEVVQVPGLIGDAGLRARCTDQGIRIDPAMLEGSTFRNGDEFDLRVEGDRIVLKKSSLSA